MHTIAILAIDGVVPFDLGIACEVFGRVRLSDGTPAYEVRVCGERATIRTSSFDLCPPGRLHDVAAADTVIVPGIENVDIPLSCGVLASLRTAWDCGARIVSICSGAFVLGAAGLLDGQRATTHWIGAEELARRYPLAEVAPDVLFVDGGRLVTSAGASAGLDMCLHLVRNDHGQAVAAHAARMAVAPLNRDGGQAQFIRPLPPVSRCNLASTLEWLLTNLNRPLDVAAMAKHAAMSERTFARQFKDQTGTTPRQWLLTARVRRAQELLESTSVPIQNIAANAGFGSPVTFRSRFQSIVGISPATYRRRFKADAAYLKLPNADRLASAAAGMLAVGSPR